MAGEVGHVVLAARTLSYLDDAVATSEFWAGALFPDIRHLGVVSRKQTHALDVSLGTLVGASDFATGMRVHSWIDMTRQRFLEEANMKESLPWHPFVPHALKLVEDEYMYDLFDDWNLILRVLNSVNDEELHYVHSKQHVDRWHMALQDYFKAKPDDESRFNLALAIGLSENSAKEINSVVELLQADERTQEMVDKFIYQFEHLLR